MIELACLAHVQGLAMKSAWESSRGPEQDPETETEREKEREGDCRAQIKFHCLFAPTLFFPPPSPYIPSFTIYPSFSTSPGTGKKPCQSLPGQGCMSVTVKPSTSCQIWQPLQCLKQISRTCNNLCSRSAEGKT